jgi:pantoate--beta-alanine ligase
MEQIHEIAALRRCVAGWRRAGLKVGFVPTMGNLHEGHLQLVRRARALCDRVVVSVFVNPTQFGPSEDFARYPRTLEQDAARLRQVDADLLFAPAVDAVYPRGTEALTRVSVPVVTQPLEGEFRPGHFDGVAGVVAILLNLVQPDVAVFGQKDYQQLLVVRRMVADLHLPVEIVGEPTQREPDGLALSSRNQYLNAEERSIAPGLHRCLVAVGERLRNGERDFAQLEAEAGKLLKNQGFKPQYLRICAADLSAPAVTGVEWVVLVAAYLGATRLIDNLLIKI